MRAGETDGTVGPSGPRPPIAHRAIPRVAPALESLISLVSSASPTPLQPGSGSPRRSISLLSACHRAQRRDNWFGTELLWQTASPPATAMSGSAGSSAASHLQSRRVTHAKSHPVIKPLLNQLSSSISGQLRRVDRAHASLKLKLEANESNMHEAIWKLKSSAAADDLSNWHSKEDLRTYLTAMSLVGSSKNGGGRTFGKDKHSFFDNIAKFKETIEAARNKKKERFRDKMRAMHIKPGTKKAAFLWQQMNLRDGSNDAMEPHSPHEAAATAAAKDTAGGTRAVSAAASAGRGRSSSDREEEKESSDPNDDAEPTAEEQEALRAAALAPDEPTAPNAAAVDSAAAAHLALQRLNATGQHKRNVSSALSLGGGHDANSSSPYGIPIPGRTPSQPISAPKQHRKAEWEIEEEAEERAEAAIAEALRKVEEEKKRKEDEEREAKRHKDMQKERPGSGVAPTAAHASTVVSRRNSLLGNSMASALKPTGSLVPSGAATPQFSRRASVVGAASSLKVLAGTRAPRALQILPDKPALATSAALRSGDLSDDLVAEEASRVMGLMFANPNMLVHAAEAARRAQADQATDRLGGAAVGIALSVPPGGGGTNSAPDSRAGSALPARSRLQALSHQEEIDRWNAKTPMSARSVSHEVVDLAHKGILSLAAEKLGVHSMDSLGGGGGNKQAEFRPAPNAKSLSTAAYLASFDARVPPAVRDAAAKRLADKSSRPASAAATPRSKKPLTNFGHSPTSATSNVHSIAAPIEFRDARGRKELVSLGATTDPKDVFAAIDKDLGSTLMSFDQLHVTNRAMAEEAKKRAEQAAIDAAAHEEVVQRKADNDAKEIDPEDVLRAKLAAKSRTRGWLHADGSPAKSLHHSGSTGHLSHKAATALAAADAAITASPTRKSPPRVFIDTNSNSVAPAAATVASPVAASAAAAETKPHLLSPSGRDYVHLSPLLIVPQWTDVTRHTAYHTLVPGYVPPPPPPPPAAVKEQVQYDVDGFVIKSANATAAPLSPTFAPLSPKPAPANDPASKRRELDARLNAELEAEGWEGSSTARRKELMRRRRIANEPSPIPAGPSVFQQQKSALLKQSYVKFVRSTTDTHRIPGAIGAQRVEDISGRRSRQSQQQQSAHDASAPTSPPSPLRLNDAPSVAGSLTPSSPQPDSSVPASARDRQE